MATFTSLEQYRNVLKNRVKELKSQKNISQKDAAKILQDTAKRLAPRHTGDTIRGIRRRKKKDVWQVESWVPGSFKQNLWANQTAPYRTPRMRWNEFKPTLYGDGTHRNTGTPRFFHFATLRTRPKFFKLTRKNTLKALRVSV